MNLPFERIGPFCCWSEGEFSYLSAFGRFSGDLDSLKNRCESSSLSFGSVHNESRKNSLKGFHYTPPFSFNFMDAFSSGCLMYSFGCNKNAQVEMFKKVAGLSDFLVKEFPEEVFRMEERDAKGYISGFVSTCLKAQRMYPISSFEDIVGALIYGEFLYTENGLSPGESRRIAIQAYLRKPNKEDFF